MSLSISGPSTVWNSKNEFKRVGVCAANWVVFFFFLNSFWEISFGKAMCKQQRQAFMLFSQGRYIVVQLCESAGLSTFMKSNGIMIPLYAIVAGLVRSVGLGVSFMHEALSRLLCFVVYIWIILTSEFCGRDNLVQISLPLILWYL